MGPSKPANSKNIGKLKPPLARTAYLISLAIKDDVEPLAFLEGRTLVINERGQKLLHSWNEIEKALPNIGTEAILITQRHIQGLLILSNPRDEALALAESVRFFKLHSAQALSHPENSKSKLKTKPLWKIGYSVCKMEGKATRALNPDWLP